MNSEDRSRRAVWHRDEVILALDLYIEEGAGATRASVAALSDELRKYPIESHLAADASFRSEAAVRRKLANFLAVETSGTAGLRHASRRDEEVWNEFAADPAGLREAAAAIRRRLRANS